MWCCKGNYSVGEQTKAALQLRRQWLTRCHLSRCKCIVRVAFACKRYFAPPLMCCTEIVNKHTHAHTRTHICECITFHVMLVCNSHSYMRGLCGGSKRHSRCAAQIIAGARALRRNSCKDSVTVTMHICRYTHTNYIYSSKEKLRTWNVFHTHTHM